MKQANTAERKWMSDIADWAEYHIDRLYGCEYFCAELQLHHVLGRSAKNNKVAIGHWFILPVPFKLHDVSSNHHFNVTHRKNNFTNQYGMQRNIFNKMYQSMKDQSYEVPSIEIYNAIMDTRA